MAGTDQRQSVLRSSDTLAGWLLESDPAIRWQVLQDLMDAPPDQVAAERSRVAREGFGARLLDLQAADGTWAGSAWNRGWTSTMHVLSLLKDLGLEPGCPEALRAVDCVRQRVTWRGCGPDECENHCYFEGEIEPCINGQVAAAGAYFGQDVRRLIERLTSEQLPDGGWNCDAGFGSKKSSFNTTICVLEAMLEFELRHGPSPAVTNARSKGEAYLLDRRLFRRKSTGATIDFDRKTGQPDVLGHPAWTQFGFPTWWHYDLLRGLEYFRRSGAKPDGRMAEAMEWVCSKGDALGRWPLEIRYPGTMPIEIDGPEGEPSRWNTLRARRVLRWYHSGGVH